MAAKTPDTYTTDGALHNRNPSYANYENCTHVILPFITENIDNGDTFDPGLSPDQVISRVAWEPTDSVAVCPGNLGTTISFVTSASNANGFLHLWIAG